jgi:hypothetical protein
VGAWLEALRKRLDELRNVEAKLEEVYQACDGEGTTNECPILSAFEMPTSNEAEGVS